LLRSFAKWIHLRVYSVGSAGTVLHQFRFAYFLRLRGALPIRKIPDHAGFLRR
jgi:hypothetical protein